MLINLFEPCFGKEEIVALQRVLESKWVGLGPETAKFEEEFARYIGISYAIGMNSCTSALDLALMLAGIGPGDEVLVPTITFISTAHAIIYRGAKPVFCDVDPQTLLIDPFSVKQKLTNKTKALIPVHYGGRCVDIDALRAIVPELFIIEDCAHACGSSWQGKKAGSLGDIGCFSFQAVKNLSIGDGGAITLNDRDKYLSARKLRWLGIDKGTWDRSQGDLSYVWEYNVEEIGYKYHMNDIAAAIGLVQLNKLDTMNEQRKAIADFYRQELSECDSIVLPMNDSKDSRSSWHLFQIQLNHRNKMIQHLSDCGIATGVHYKPIHLYKCYGKQPSLPVAEEIWNKILSLPMHANLTIEQVYKITNAIKNSGLI